MKDFKKIQIFLILLAFSAMAHAQNAKISIAGDTLQNSNPTQILILYSNGLQNVGLVVKNDISNFTYHGRIFDIEKNEYIIFSSYSESVGCKYYYLFDVQKNKIYSSQAVLELEVPFIFSFNRNTLTMNLVSYDPLSCGKVSPLSFKVENLLYYNPENLKRLKIYLSINL
jgi:hypothetical protein